MSLVFPGDISSRKHVDAGVRGRSEAYLRVLRGRIDTTTPTILQGVGFSAAQNGVGDITLTFDPPFSDIPAVDASADRAVGANGFVVYQSAAPTASTCRLVRATQAGAAEDGTLSFTATGRA